MASKTDIRWIQRLANFSKALRQLQKFIGKGNLNELEEQGLIKSFEYTYELAWNVIKDFYEEQGETGIQGSPDRLGVPSRNVARPSGSSRGRAGPGRPGWPG